MNGWRFAFERRWFGYLAMAVVFAIACVLLSRWQIGRNNETVVENRLINLNYGAAAVPLGSILASESEFHHSMEWRRVTFEGRYLPGKQLLVRDRSLGSNPGFEVLTPMKLTDGTVFIVDRGWLPIGSKQSAPDSVPAAPSGLVHVVARLQGSESVIPGRTSPSGQISEINLPTVARTLASSTSSTFTGAYGLMASETPAPPVRPIAAVKPALDPGPFLSYAVQWILFAIAGFAGLGWALRQEYRIRNSEDPAERERAAERARKARAKAPTDAEIEDAQIAAAVRTD